MANAALDGDQKIFELGCGTGRFATHLLGALPASVHYLGVDVSPVMINLATSRLAAWAERAKVVLVDGSLPLPADDGFVDRVLATFVFDLLDAEYARAVLDDLQRILAPDGRLCLASLTDGDGLFERVVSRSWTGLWRVAPQLVGGCRPIAVTDLLSDDWQVLHHSRIHRWGLVTDVVIAVPSTPQR